MKKKFLLFLMISFVNNNSSANITDVFKKFALFYGIEFTTTNIHELGHALMYKWRDMSPKVTIGKNQVQMPLYSNERPTYTLGTWDPTSGVTGVPKIDGYCNYETPSQELNRSIGTVAAGGVFNTLTLLLLTYSSDTNFR